jgi:chemotaxis protein MotB
MKQEPVRATKRRYTTEQEGDAGAQRERWLISFADLMTLLFALFVVLYAAADRERGRAVAEALAGQVSSTGSAGGGSGVLPGGTSVTETQMAVERVLLVNEALRTRARLMKASSGFVISLAEAGFFAPGEATVRPEALALLDTLAETLRETSLLIRVEGHTDATPIATARYPSNWELSACRASAVLAELAARGIGPARLSVAGYASEKPVASNDTAEGRALNRRVDLVILQTQ